MKQRNGKLPGPVVDEMILAGHENTKEDPTKPLQNILGNSTAALCAATKKICPVNDITAVQALAS